MPSVNILKPRQALNKAYLKSKVNRSHIEAFKTNLISLLDTINEAESEEFHKNLVADFLKNTWYAPGNFINTKGRNDLVIHNTSNASGTVGVIIEAKKPSNKAEMVKPDNLNCKAFQELVLYYLRERITHKNLEIKHLVATNIFEWYIFDAALFEKEFAQNKNLVKQFTDFEEGRLSGTKTDFFYKEIAQPAIEAIKNDIPFTRFDIRDYDKPLRNNNTADDNTLIALYKLLSPEHLLKLPFANDSNSLDKAFYSELLHIIGLIETKDGGKKLIQRKKEGERNHGSLLENTITQLDSHDKISRITNPSQYGANYQERLFNVALELVITWVNRVLFLKLLEAQLIAYHKGDKQFAFLNMDKIRDFDDLDKLFFRVLARKVDERDAAINQLFGKVPYLNSSLFEPTELEHQTIFVSGLEDFVELPFIASTVIKDANGKKLGTQLNTIQYLFEFLNAYDFSSEGSEEIQENNKQLINASVLGLIFEKINGYKDGSFFTPGFITMYMCRETIRRAVLDKFNLTPSPSPGGEGDKKRASFDHNPTISSPPSPFGEGTGVRSNTPGEGPELRKTDNDLGPRSTVETNLPPYLLQFARELRKNQTDAEEYLWQLLRNRQFNNLKFRRQHPLSEGFILDFYCAELKLAIEVDGGYHNDITQREYDEGRTFLLEKYNIRVIRFTNEQVLNNVEVVLKGILLTTSPFLLTPSPYPNGEGDKERASSDHTTTISSPPSPFGEGTGVRFKSLTDVYNAIGTEFTIQQANAIVNSIKICDPAVGSGHFLVSALNEMIAIKSELKILSDRQGKRLKEYQLIVENDELIVTDEDGQLFEYNPRNPESQRIQETLFHEKQSIIENCLFGVDLNPNSVKICRLRLWIELLKNAYYLTPSPSPGGEGDKKRASFDHNPTISSPPSPNGEGTGVRRNTPGDGPSLRLETLPNIDINIKCGNSLISRYALDADIKKALKASKWSIDSYRTAVMSYRNAKSKDEKRDLERLINTIKNDFESEVASNDKRLADLNKAKGTLLALTTQTSLFERSKAEKAKWDKDVNAASDTIARLETQLAEIRNNRIYENAFEWRFEFPEVLNDEGDFVGFDVVIGNPPYIRQEELSDIKNYLQSNYQTYAGTADLYVYFVERGLQIANKNGHFVYILPNKWMRAGYGAALRKWVTQYNIRFIHDFGDLPVFEEATTYPCLWGIEKGSKPHGTFTASVIDTLNFPTEMGSYIDAISFDVNKALLAPSGWTLVDDTKQNLLEKIKSKGIPLGEYVNGKVYYGIKTGYNEAFVIDAETKNRLIAEDPNSAHIIKPFLAGRDIKRYQQPQSDKFLILFKSGDTQKWFGKHEEAIAWEMLKDKYPAIANFLIAHRENCIKRSDKGQYWWELRACVYYDEFEESKVILPDIALCCQALYDTNRFYCGNTAYIIPSLTFSDLGILNSNLMLFFYSNLTQTIRGGYFRFIKQYLEQIPIIKTDILEDKVTEIIALKTQSPCADTTALESEIDQLVYQLYGLTAEEIKLIEGA